MTIALAIIGGIVIILGAATRIPPAAAAFLRACIPLITALHDLRDALGPGHDRKVSSAQLNGDHTDNLGEEPGANTADLE